jgi:hypothetical protein
VTNAGSGRFMEAHHEGYLNLTTDLAEIKSRFAGASKIVFWGASAGGLGVDCNLSKVRNTWPTPPMFEFNDAGPPIFGREQGQTSTVFNQRACAEQFSSPK